MGLNVEISAGTRPGRDDHARRRVRGWPWTNDPREIDGAPATSRRSGKAGVAYGRAIRAWRLPEIESANNVVVRNLHQLKSMAASHIMVRLVVEYIVPSRSRPIER